MKSAIKYLAASLSLVVAVSAEAALIPLVDQDTLVDQPVDGVVDASGGATVDGYALNAPGFIDVAVYSFDFGTTGSVSSATLATQVSEIYGTDPTIDLFAYGDNGVVEVSDFALGSGTIWDSSSYSVSGDTALIDVTALVNSFLGSSQYIGFRFENSRGPAELSTLEGVRFSSVSLDATFDGQVPAPATLALLGFGLACIGYQRRKHVKAA